MYVNKRKLKDWTGKVGTVIKWIDNKNMEGTIYLIHEKMVNSD